MATTDEHLSPAIEEVVAGVEAFIAQEVTTRHEAHRALFEDAGQLYTAEGRYVPQVLEMIREVRVASAEAGYYTMFVPEDLGGGGMGATLLFHVWEAIFRRCAAHHWLGWHVVGHWAKGPSPVIEQTRPAVREEVLPRLMSGEASACFALSEPDAGSDLWGMRTTAERVGQTWRINGVKQWITNGPYADYILVFAVTEPEALRTARTGITAFLLPAEAPGVSVPSVIRMFGHSGSDEGVINFDDVIVTDEHVVGEVGNGMAIAQLGIGIGKLYNAAKSIGMARWAMSLAVDQVRERSTFGRPLSDRQGIMFPLAESAMDIHAARLMALDCARRMDADDLHGVEIPMMKAFSSEAALRAVDRVIQTHGASGLTNELHLTEAWMHIRKICIADGTAELMRQQVARAIAGGRIKF